MIRHTNLLVIEIETFLGRAVLLNERRLWAQASLKKRSVRSSLDVCEVLTLAIEETASSSIFNSAHSRRLNLRSHLGHVIGNVATFVVWHYILLAITHSSQLGRLRLRCHGGPSTRTAHGDLGLGADLGRRHLAIVADSVCRLMFNSQVLSLHLVTLLHLANSLLEGLLKVARVGRIKLVATANARLHCRLVRLLLLVGQVARGGTLSLKGHFAQPALAHNTVSSTFIL